MSYDLSEFIRDYPGDSVAKENFIRLASAYLGCKTVVPVTNGTQAIEIALRAAGLNRGDAVIVPDISFIATATAVANTGMIPVYADISKDYYGLTLQSLKDRYTSAVKAVIVVHFSGFVNREIFEIKDFCQARNLVLVEDCAQSFCCSAKGIKTGALGDLGTFSFQSSKIVNSGEGGMISSVNSALGAECESIADWGMSPAFPQRRFDIASSNFRLSAAQCYFLARQIEKINAITEARTNRCKELESACSQLGLKSALPVEREGFADCPFFFPIKSRNNANMIEPREESPMHRSKMVTAIMERFFPDLLRRYREINPPDIFIKFSSEQVIADIDFINISQTEKLLPEQVFTAYR